MTHLPPLRLRERDLEGTLTVSDVDFWAYTPVGEPSGDWMPGGYSDVGAGTQVAVVDGSGQLLGVGRIGMGETVGTFETNLEYIQSTACRLPFTVEDLPTGEAFYVIQISHRGDVVYSFDDLDTTGWTVGLNLG